MSNADGCLANSDLLDLLDADDPDLQDVAKWVKAHGPVVAFCSAAHPEDDPAPLHTRPARVGHNVAWLVAGCNEVAKVLGDSVKFGNAPYREIGGGGFMLAMDDVNEHRRQRVYVETMLKALSADKNTLRGLCTLSVDHACLAGLQRDEFDLAALAEQAALRFCQLAFGFALADLGLLQATAKAGYRALSYQIVGRHIGLDPTMLPTARQQMAAMTRRASSLIAEYGRCKRTPRDVRGRLPNRVDRAAWPEGIEPPSVWGLAGHQPLLRQMAEGLGSSGGAAQADVGFSIHELAALAASLIVGTVGNVQASVCLVMRQILRDPACHLAAAEAARDPIRSAALRAIVDEHLAAEPPVAFLPRRALKDCDLGGQQIKKGQDLVLWLGAAALPATGGCPHALAFGGDNPSSPARHTCVGNVVARALVVAIVERLLRLPSLAEGLDPVTGQVRGVERRWRFACEHYWLSHRRNERFAQWPLNVVMRVKSPVDVHAAALRQVIAAGAPRIERALRASNHIHFAWFNFLEQDRLLALHTVYDGNFDAYIQHFALEVDDLFDQLFQHIEGAPPLPVAENPGAFVDVIRAFDVPVAQGYVFSAYPSLETQDVTRHERRPA